MAKQLLQQYIKLTEFLGRALGPDYEVALHDMTDKNRSVVAIANGHISGRQVGAPLTNVALRTLRERTYEEKDYLLHYPGESAKGNTLRSSTWFIKHNGKLVGMLCINFDDSRYRELGKQLLELCHPAEFEVTDPRPGGAEEEGTRRPPERFHNSIHGVAGDAVARELTRMGLSAKRLTVEERISIINALEASGIFLLKGAVKDVAKALHCSQASVYRYLTQIRREAEQ